MDFTIDPNRATGQQLTIHEAISTALSNSEVVRNLGLVDAQSDVDIIRGRITTYDPLAAWAAASGEWGIFDPLWTTEMQWDRIDIPPGTSFSGIGDRPPELDTADFFTSLEQLLPLGSRVRMDYVTNYLFNPDHPPSLDPNPQYFSYTQFSVIQPLCQGLGVNLTMAPIRIAAAEAERTDWRFKQEVLAMVRSVETAYWTLYSEQQNLRAFNESLPLFREIVRVREQQARGAAGTETEVARATSEMLLYEQRRLDTMSRIAEQQLVLRNLMGLPADGSGYLSLVALPISTPPFQSVGDAVMTAVNQRPDMLRQRIAVYVAQQERVVARDSLRPKFDFNAFWRINGLGEDLGESLDVIGQNDFHDWQLGFRLQVPLGRRQGRANVRAAELVIQKERALLDQTAHQASYEVADAYRRIIWLHEQYRVSASRVEALTKWREGARAQFENPPPGISTVLALELYLNNLRDFIEASIKSNAILADFNSALARLEEVKGTLLETRLIEVVGDQTDKIPEELPRPTLLDLPEWMVPVPSNRESSDEASGTDQSTGSSVPVVPKPVAPLPSLAQPEVRRLPLAIAATPPSEAPQSLTVSPPVASDVRVEPLPAESVNNAPTRHLTNWVAKDPPLVPAPSAAQTLNQLPTSVEQNDLYRNYSPMTPAIVQQQPRLVEIVPETERVSPAPAVRGPSQLATRSINPPALPKDTTPRANGVPSQLIVLPETNRIDRNTEPESEVVRESRRAVAPDIQPLKPADLSELYADAPVLRRAETATPNASLQSIAQTIPLTSRVAALGTRTAGPNLSEANERRAETTTTPEKRSEVELGGLSTEQTDAPPPQFDLTELYTDCLKGSKSKQLKPLTSQTSSDLSWDAQLNHRPISQRPGTTSSVNHDVVDTQQQAPHFTITRSAAPDLPPEDSRQALTPLAVFQRLARFWAKPESASIPSISEPPTDLTRPSSLVNPEAKYVAKRQDKALDSHYSVTPSLVNPEAWYVDEPLPSFDRTTPNNRLAQRERIRQTAPKAKTEAAGTRNEIKPLVNPAAFLLRRNGNRASDRIN